jgi:hypothetical protein
MIYTIMYLALNAQVPEQNHMYHKFEDNHDSRQAGRQAVNQNQSWSGRPSMKIPIYVHNYRIGN